MSFNNINNQEYLHSLLTNDEQLLHDILKTKGFILEKMKSYGFMPDLDFLVDNINIFNLQFISSNYKLNPHQSEKINLFTNPDYNKQKIAAPTAILNDEQLLISIEQEQQFSDKNIFSNHLLEKHYVTILENKENNDVIKRVLRKSLANLSVDEINSFNDEAILGYISYLHDMPHLFRNAKFSERYKTIVQEHNKEVLESEKKTIENQYLGIQYFKHYLFLEEDRNFLIELLKNDNSSFYYKMHYNDMMNISGVKNILSKDEYFEYYNDYNINLYTQDETEEKAYFIRQVWLKKSADDNDLFSKITLLESSLEQFSTLVNKQFVYDMCNSHNYNNFTRYIDTDNNSDLTTKIYLVQNYLLELYNENPEVNNPHVEAEKFEDLVRFYYHLSNVENLVQVQDYHLDSNYLYLKEQNNANIEVFLKELSERSLLNHNFTETVNTLHSKTHSYNREVDDLYESIFEKILYEKNSINALYLGLLIDSQNKKQSNLPTLCQQIVHNIINDKSITEDELKNNVVLSLRIVEHFKNHFSTSDTENQDRLQFYNSLIKEFSIYNDNGSNHIINTINSVNKEDKKENIFLYDIDTIDNMQSETLSLIYNIRPEVLDEVNQFNKKVSNNFLYHCLSNTKNPIIRTFLKAYAVRHKNDIDNDQKLLSSFLSNKYQTDIFEFNNHNVELENLLTIVELSKNYSNTYEQKQIIYNLFSNNFFSDRYNIPYSRDKLTSVKGLPLIEDFDENIPFNIENADQKSLKIRHVLLSEKSSFYSAQVKELEKMVSYDTFEELFKELIEQKDYLSIFALSQTKESMTKSSMHHFIEYVNSLNFEQLKENLSQSYFIKLIYLNIDYDNKTAIKLGPFTKEENFYIADKLLEGIKVPSDEKMHYKSKPFHFFSMDNRSFIKDYVIENLPLNIMYTFDFELYMGKENSISKARFVNEAYTYEEILRTYRNCEKEGGIFNYFDVNASYDHIFSHTFYPYQTRTDDKKEVKNKFDYFLGFANYIKDKEPRLYAIVLGSVLTQCDKITEKDNNGEKLRYKDQIANYIFNEYFDLDTALYGLRLIIEDAREKPKSNNPELIARAVSELMALTRHEIYENDDYRRIIKRSYLDDKATDKIFEFFVEMAPTNLLQRSIIGNCTNIESYLSSNKNTLCSLESLDNLLFPKLPLANSYFKLEKDSPNYERLKNIVSTYVEYARENKNKDIVEYIKYVTDQNRFIKKEIGDNLYKVDNYTEILTNIYHLTPVKMLSNDNWTSSLIKSAELQIKLEEKLDSQKLHHCAPKKKI